MILDNAFITDVFIFKKTKAMNSYFSRRRFLVLTSGGLLGLGLLRAQSQQSIQKAKDPLNPEIVKDFVRKGHFDLEGVKKALEDEAGLLNAVWDWGGGDFETALGGASHMGRSDIAEFLITKGTRMDIFCAAMLGRLEIVEAITKAYPSLIESKGPHGITLLLHAQKGGEKAASVVEYLKNKGITK